MTLARALPPERDPARMFPPERIPTLVFPPQRSMAETLPRERDPIRMLLPERCRTQPAASCTDGDPAAPTAGDTGHAHGSTPQASDPLMCGIAGIGAVSAASAQRIACDAMIQTITYDKDGHVLDLGRTKRFVTKAQRRALIARDSCCQFPGVRREALVDRVEVKDLHRCPVAAG